MPTTQPPTNHFANPTTLLQKLQKENDRLRATVRECEERAARREREMKRDTTAYDKALEDAAVQVGDVLERVALHRIAARQITASTKIAQGRQCEHA